LKVKSILNYDSLQSTLKWNFIDKFFSWTSRAKLKNRDFSIIGNNCFVGGIYHKYGLKYTSPTIWTYIFAEDYLNLLENLEWYLHQPLEFIESSKHDVFENFPKLADQKYPIGLLGGDVEIHFLHYKTQRKALDKWTTRLKRLRMDKLFVLFSDSKEFKEEHLEKFSRLPFKNKIFFSAKPRIGNGADTVFIRDYACKPFVFDVTRNRKYEKYLDLTRWLNGQPAYIKER
jgi:uncharacterized protein (DUF1919 family)